MGMAIPRATNGKNRPTLGTIFSAVRAARAAKFGRRVVLEGPYNISFAIWYFHFRFGNYGGLKKNRFPNFSPKRCVCWRISIYRVVVLFKSNITVLHDIGIPLPVSEPRPLEERYPECKKSTNFGA